MPQIGNDMTKTRNPYKYLYLFQDFDDDTATVNAQELFLRQFWADYSSFGILAFRHRETKRFIERPIQPSQLTISTALSHYNRWDWDQYFCPNTFFEPNRRKQFARDTRLAWCDVDEADPFGFRPPPSVVWETSPWRYQALWVWDATLTLVVGRHRELAVVPPRDGKAQFAAQKRGQGAPQGRFSDRAARVVL